jgi:hypothetical protein
MSTARKISKKISKKKAPHETAKTEQPSPPATRTESTGTMREEAAAVPERRNGADPERRDGADRRDNVVDRRAFWRPTPDRRREDRELGRRESDLPPS